MKHIFPSNNYVVFDFETTGLNPLSGDSVIQMSVIKKKDGEWQAPFNLYIKNKTPLPAIITEITGITDAELAEKGVEEETAWREFAEYIENLPMVGHNVISFDRVFLEEAFKKYQIPLPSYKRYVDTAMLYKALKIDKSPFWYEDHFAFARRVGEIRAFGIRYKLTICCEELGINISQFQAHRSDGDIAMTNLIYEHFVEKL